MTSYVLRLGKTLEADEVFYAWTSGDLRRMLAAVGCRTNPIDRHFLLLNIASLSYHERGNTEMRRICREIGARHVEEFATIAPLLAEDMGGTLPRVPTFAHLATVLAEDGEIEQAIAVCARALAFGLHDGTKGDYAGRIERLRRRQRLAQKRDA